MALPERTHYTEAEYLAFDLESEYKNEYANGEIIAMAGGSPEHSFIILDTQTSLNIQTRDSNCNVYESGQRVQVKATGAYRYPDGTVVCGEPKYADTKPKSLINPTLLIEVLSASTSHIDQFKKLNEYGQIPSVKEYLIISQDEPQVLHYVKQEQNKWFVTVIGGLDKTIELKSIGCVLQLSEFYRRVSFEEEDLVTED